jgi:hypothetical protein
MCETTSVNWHFLQPFLKRFSRCPICGPIMPSPYHNPLLALFQIFYTLLASLNVRISRGLEQFHSLNLVESALVTRAAKDD